jgi:NAD(P)-dependent dehydrogenase (short-subunit alcohol dehydrogenase family)
MLPNQREGLLRSKLPKKDLARSRSKAWSIKSEPIYAKVNLGVDRGRVSYHDEDDCQCVYFLCCSFSDLYDEDGATIVKVSLVAGTESSRTGAAYGMSKASINHFTQMMAYEWAAL